MNVYSLIELLVIIDECKRTDNVIAALERLVRSYGFDYYGLSRQPKSNADPMGLVLAGRSPKAWPDIYIAKKYILVDPTIRYLGRAQRPFRWRDTLSAFKADPNRQRMECMMLDARRHGLHDGYIFPIHGRCGLLGNMTIGGNVVDLSPVEISLFDAVARKVFWRILDIRDEACHLEQANTLDTQLTRRETEIVRYLVDGLTSMEISKLISISNHTVDWYINGIQEKLKARNRQHIVALAFRYGLVS